MKNLIKFLIMLWCICLLNACDESKPTGVKPPSLAGYTITPIHGGATITYSLPNDHRDILYVMAEYERNGQMFTERSSAYNNSLTIEGFNTTNPVSAILYTVSRDDQVKSDPMTIQFTPLESPISLIHNSTRIIPCFGGVQITWENIAETEVGVFLMVDSLGTLLEKDVYFSALASGLRSVRGLEAVETSFVLTYEDKWGNMSEQIHYTGTPLFEIEVPKPWSDIRHRIPHDNVTDLNATLVFRNIWDGILGLNNRYLSALGGAGSSFTFDFGQVMKLSRFIMWPTISGAYAAKEDVYGQVHIHEFDMYGTPVLDESKLTDAPYWLHPLSAELTGQTLPEHTFMDDWVFLGHFSIERLDLLGASDADILSQGVAGHQWDIPIECGPVRYIRIFPYVAGGSGPPPPNNYWQINEMSFFGDYVNSQN